MGRHSRRGPAPAPAPLDDTEAVAAGRGRRRRGTPDAPPPATPGPQAQQAAPRGQAPQGPARGQAQQGPSPYRDRGAPPNAGPGRGFPEGTPAHGFPQAAEPQGPTSRGFSEATPAHGFPQATPPRGFPAQGTPAHGSPRVTPSRGFPQGTPAHGVPHVRGGHPQQFEGGARGETRMGVGYAASPVVPTSRSRPRQDYVDAFAPPAGPSDPYADVTDWDGKSGELAAGSAELTETAESAESLEGEEPGDKRRKGRTYTGIAAAAVTTVLAVVVAGHVVQGRGGGADAHAQSAGGPDDKRSTNGSASRSDNRATPGGKARPVTPLTYDQKMAKTYPLSARLKGSGKFAAVPGFDKAPGKGEKFRYRIDVENGLGLDGALFAQAVQKTLNDDRSWAHDGGRTFERISSGKPDFVITLASPGTTGVWCEKSGLDTTEDNVSCDSAATDRVMINAYRWAQGSKTYGNKIHLYRQMLINHEVGHRLGFNHVTCTKNGALAPVMQQQTKFLTFDGITCKPNPWAFPES
ncbi:MULTISPECIES: DUF3152 domain-containing protein [unclassified Streptomyces]|uniref:DUF3152 domain-containing protein n=1 Tax=unclassified Streptomyces TaxID=2593676 RepID=UPI0036ED9E39